MVLECCRVGGNFFSRGFFLELMGRKPVDGVGGGIREFKGVFELCLEEGPSPKVRGSSSQDSLVESGCPG